MAKYTYNYACGHGVGETELFGKVKDRERKLEWMESTMVCPECYKKQKAEENNRRGLELHVALNPYSVKNSLVLYFDGDTMPNKDAIKNLGYKWGDRPSIGLFGCLDYPQKSWSMITVLENLDVEIKKAEEIGAKIINSITELDILTYTKFKKERDEKEAAKNEEINKLEKPVVPKVLSGATWNRTIYGKKGNYSFYNDGKKVNITDAEAKEIEEYLNNKAKYNKATQEIEKKFY